MVFEQVEMTPVEIKSVLSLVKMLVLQEQRRLNHTIVSSVYIHQY